MLAVLAVSAMAALPPRPAPPGPESWDFRRELAEPPDAAYAAPAGEPWLKDRISRCFFGPIKRAPYNRDELMDDVDYYPDGYLERLRRDGVNGLWITVEFLELAETRFFPRDPGAERRLAKLSRTVEKCARYGIKVWVFALEPKWLAESHPFRAANPGLFVRRGDHFAMCPELPEVQEYLETSARDIFTKVPGLGGFIGITHGEDITSCFSYKGEGCPRCEGLPCWRMHNDIVGPILRGARAGNPEARVISWFYQPEARTGRPEWVRECAAHIPEGVSLMYNFESGLLAKQLDRWRVGGDYWLSQPGPGAPFARLSAASGRGELAAKIQMACSHEDATVPYIPVPGLLWRKFKAMRECGVQTAMLSWYFGNYPCMMSRAAWMLAHEDFSGGEDSFLRRLAAGEWGGQAEEAVRIWKAFADAYSHYPVSNYMQYYGPYHAGVAWALYPQVEMKPLEPTWMPHYAPAGDAIGECLRDFTLDEALALSERVASVPEPGLSCATRREKLDAGVMKAVRLQFIAARDAFRFYRARSEAIWLSRGLGRHDLARRPLAEMKAVLERGLSVSAEMSDLCESDSRLGFHSEAEAHQFFPARLKWRMGAIKLALRDVDAIDRALASGLPYPESDRERLAPGMVLDSGLWSDGAGGFRVRARRLPSGGLLFEGEASSGLDAVNVAMYDAAAAAFPLAYRISRGGALTSPVWNGEPRSAAPAVAESHALQGGRWNFSLEVPPPAWGGSDRLRPGWAFFYGDGKTALWPATGAAWPENRLWHPLSPAQFGRIASSCPGDTRPYEFIDAGRSEDEVLPLEDFESGPGWIAEPAGAAFAETSSRRMLFGAKTLEVSCRGAAEVRIRPPKPIALPPEHGWFAAWIRNDPAFGSTGNGRKGAPSASLVFSDGNGEEVRLPLRNFYGSSRLDWPDWWYAVRRFSRDELEILDSRRLSFNGFALTGCTNACAFTVHFDNVSFFNMDESIPLAVPYVPAVPVPARPEGALPASAAPGSSNTAVREGDAVRLRYSGDDGTLEYVWRGSMDTLEVSWNGGPPFRPMAGGGAKSAPGRASCTPSIAGKTLVLEVTAPAGESGISLGHPEGAAVLSRSFVPALGDGYWWDGSRSQVSAVDTGAGKVFVLAFPDWYASAASAVAGEKRDDGTFDRVCEYRMRTDGTRNPVRERIYLTVSPEFMDVMPVVANPPSPWRHVTGSKAWCRYSSGPDRSKAFGFLKWLHRNGIRELVVNEHECCMRDDGESFTFRDKSAPRKGGDGAWRMYSQRVRRELGFRYGPYNNFTDLAPVNANWRLGNVSRKSPMPDAPDSGGLVPAWMRCYAPKAAFAYAACARYAPKLKEKYGFDTAYCDVHTAILPWEYVDCDARVPGGGSFQPFYRAYAAILLEQKKAWNGPVYSEGGSHFFYAGLADGNYGQLGVRADKDPWIADFDLKRLHPLECDFGVGNLDMFLPGLTRDSSAPELVGAVDRFLAATLAFGHTAFLVLDMMKERRCDTGDGYPDITNRDTPAAGLPFALRSYHMVRPAAALYTQAAAEEILYLCGDAGWLGVSAAILSGDRRMQQIAVRYSDGTCVVANGHAGKRLAGRVFGRDVDLPPCGYMAWNEARGLEIESGDRTGARTDYSASADAIYLDTRSSPCPAGFPMARGKGLATCRREGAGWEIVPVRGEVSFRIAGRSARALDEAGADIGEAVVARDGDGFARIRPVDGAFSYIVTP